MTERYVNFPWFIGTILAVLLAAGGIGTAIFYPKSDGTRLEQCVKNIERNQQDQTAVLARMEERTNTQLIEIRDRLPRHGK